MTGVGDEEVRQLLDELYAVRRLPKVGAYDHLPRPLRSRAFVTAFIEALRHHGRVAGSERMLLHRLMTGGYVGDLEPEDRWRLFIELFVLPVATKIPLPGVELSVVTAFHVFLGSPPLPDDYVSPDEAPRLPRSAVASAYEGLTATLRPEDGWLRFVLNGWLYGIGHVPDANAGGIPTRPRDAVTRQIELLIQRESAGESHGSPAPPAWDEPEPYVEMPAFDLPDPIPPMVRPTAVPATRMAPQQAPVARPMASPTWHPPPLTAPTMPVPRGSPAPGAAPPMAPAASWTSPRPSGGIGSAPPSSPTVEGGDGGERNLFAGAPDGPPTPPAVQRLTLDPAMLKSAVGGALRAATARAGIVARQLGISIDETPNDEQVREFLGRFAAFDALRLPGATSVAAVPPEEAEGLEFWFAGDVHGDLLALEAVLAAFDGSSSPRRVLCFLGDLVDEGPHTHEVVLRVLEAMAGRPGQIVWLAGDRDEAFAWSEERQSFTAQPAPHGWVDELNGLSDDDPAGRLKRAVGRWAAAIIPELPRALFLPGLLAAHGGFPHTDLVDRLDALHQLGQPLALRDFVRNRCNGEAPTRPSRRTSEGGAEFGGRDFERFRQKVTSLGLPVEGFVRGHDHVQTAVRWSRPETPRGHFEGRVLTINSLSFTLASETGAVEQPPRARVVTVARRRPGERLPVPIELVGTQRLVDWYAPACPACQLPNPLGADRCVRVRTVGGVPETCDTPLPVSR